MKNRIRILHVVATLDAAGAEKQLVELCGRLDKNRFDISICCLTRGGPLEERVRQLQIPYTIMGKKHKLDFSVILGLMKVLKESRIDVLHTWMFTSNFFGRIAGIISRVPIIIISERACDIWKSPFHFLLDRTLLAWTDKVICVSDGVKKFCMRKYGLPEHKAVVIYNGIEISDVSNPDDSFLREFDDLRDRRVLFAAGRLAEQKGFRYLLCSMQRVMERFPDVVLMIAGEGDILRELQELSVELGLEKHVLFLGPRRDIHELIRFSEIFLLPSLYEGLPNVVLEAMHEEKAVIATDVPGTNEVVVDGKSGILVPTKDDVALSSAIIKLLDDRELAVKMGFFGRDVLTGRFRIEDMVRQYENLYMDFFGLHRHPNCHEKHLK